MYILVISDVIYATGSLGTLNIKISNSDFGRRRAGILQLFNVRTSTGQRPLQYAGSLVARQSQKVLGVCSASSLENLCECFVDVYLCLLYLA